MSTTRLAVSYTREWLKYGLVFALFWLLLTQGEVTSWGIGMVAVPLATWCHIRLFVRADEQLKPYHHKFNLITMIQFTLFFFKQSLKGGWESALFAIRPSLRVRPAFISYATHLPAGSARLFFVNIISLLPGTLSADLKLDSLTIHVLDAHADNKKSLQQCEAVVAKLFSISISDTTLTSTSLKTGK